jgi:hypothetical protein
VSAAPRTEPVADCAPAGSGWPEIPLASYLAALPVWRRRIVLRSEGELRLPAFRGALWHSVVGRALKELVCTVPPGVCDGCRRREGCEYPAVMESRSVGPGAGPLAGGARIPGPLIFDSGPWQVNRLSAGDMFVLDFTVVGQGSMLVTLVEQAIERAASAGLGSRRVPARVVDIAPRPPLREMLASSQTAALSTLLLRLVTPLRLKREGTYLRRFDLAALARDLSFRVAALGHYHGSLPWPAPWRAAIDAARVARVVEARVRWVERVRYSARQKREIIMGGLVGKVCIEGVGPELLRLLAAGTVIHAGKCASMGLGELEVDPTVTAGPVSPKLPEER